MKTIIALIIAASLSSCAIRFNPDGSRDLSIDGVQSAALIARIIEEK